MGKREVTEIEIKRIKELTSSGESRYEIARILNRSTQTIWRYQKDTSDST